MLSEYPCHAGLSGKGRLSTVPLTELETNNIESKKIFFMHLFNIILKHNRKFFILFGYKDISDKEKPAQWRV